MSTNNSVSLMYIEHLATVRASVNSFLGDAASRWATRAGRLLDVAPQIHQGARPFFPANIRVETLDIDPKAGTTYTADLCECSATVPAGVFDYVVCTEVLEHTLNPFKAVETILRILKPLGCCFVTTPFNLRIHGPLPDCWRFTDHGLRELFRSFQILELTAVETPERFLMPIHYRLVARKPAN